MGRLTSDSNDSHPEWSRWTNKHTTLNQETSFEMERKHWRKIVLIEFSVVYCLFSAHLSISIRKIRDTIHQLAARKIRDDAVDLKRSHRLTVFHFRLRREAEVVQVVSPPHSFPKKETRRRQKKKTPPTSLLNNSWLMFPQWERRPT